MGILFFRENVDFSWEQKDKICPLIHNIIQQESAVEPGEISIIFCTDDYLLDINVRYLDHNYYTDIITFPYSSSPLNADLYISIDRVKENADQLNENFHNELHRVIIHGILHLCGYSDQTSSEKKIIREKEDHYLLMLLKTTNKEI